MLRAPCGSSIIGQIFTGRYCFVAGTPVVVDQAAVSEITTMAGANCEGDSAYQPWYGVTAIALTSALLVLEHRRRKRHLSNAGSVEGKPMASQEQLMDELFSDDRWLNAALKQGLAR